MLSIIVLLMASAATLGQAQSNVIWSKWTDPKENAFSLEVPQGWYVEGGLFRNPENPALDLRPYIRVTSPDGTIIITRWAYRFPNVYTGQQLSGLDFAELYLSKYPEAGCTGITITSIDNRGRVDYSCYKNGILMAGAIAAQTAPIGSSWALRDLQSYLAPAQQAKIVESLLSHMVETSNWNPQWTASNANSEQYANQQYINNANQALNGYLNQMAEQNSVTNRYWKLGGILIPAIVGSAKVPMENIHLVSISMLYSRKISIRRQPKHLSDQESIWGSVVIPSELLAEPLAGVETMTMCRDNELHVLMLTPADKARHDSS